MAVSSSSRFDFVLFDLGGVLVRLRGPDVLSGLRGRRRATWESVGERADDHEGTAVTAAPVAHRQDLAADGSPADLWALWVRSEWVKRFQRGQCSAEDFCIGLVREWGLEISPEIFLDLFRTFPASLYDGALSLVSDVGQRVNIGCLSNTNSVHWDLISRDWGLGALFGHAFLSHQMGHVKPDRAAFDHVVGKLGVPAARIVLVDDSPENVEGAQRAGLTAVHARGPAEARLALSDLGIL